MFSLLRPFSFILFLNFLLLHNISQYTYFYSFIIFYSFNIYIVLLPRSTHSVTKRPKSQHRDVSLIFLCESNELCWSSLLHFKLIKRRVDSDFDILYGLWHTTKRKRNDLYRTGCVRALVPFAAFFAGIFRAPLARRDFNIQINPMLFFCAMAATAAVAPPTTTSNRKINVFSWLTWHKTAAGEFIFFYVFHYDFRRNCNKSFPTCSDLDQTHETEETSEQNTDEQTTTNDERAIKKIVKKYSAISSLYIFFPLFSARVLCGMCDALSASTRIKMNGLGRRLLFLPLEIYFWAGHVHALARSELFRSFWQIKNLLNRKCKTCRFFSLPIVFRDDAIKQLVSDFA